MATWVTHLMISDIILSRFPNLDRRGFCVGSIAPDCNIENEDWTAFIPPREVTHWMRDGKKDLIGAERFFQSYALPCVHEPASREKLSFMLGYYVHLIADVAYPAFVHDEERVGRMWNRFLHDERLRSDAQTLSPSWEHAKRLVSKEARMRELSLIEAEYLQVNPESGFLTEIIPLKMFPDYLDYLLPGSITRKVRIMAQIPKPDPSLHDPIVITREELYGYVQRTAAQCMELLRNSAAAAFLSVAENE